jgi:hypothetical protein
MLQAFVEEIAVYAALPGEQLEGEVLAMCERNLRLFFRCLSEQRVPHGSELTELRASATRRAEEGVPLQAVLSAYHVGGRIGWQALVEDAHDDEHDELVGQASWLLRYLETVVGTVATAYLEEQQLIYGEHRDARRTFADALLTGRRTASDGPGRDRLATLAERAGVVLGESYLVMATRVSPSGDERTTGVSSAVAGRRKVRRLEERMEQLADGPVVSLLDPAGGLLLVPTDAVRGPQLLEHAAGIVSELSVAADAPVLAGVAWQAEWNQVAAAATEARELLRIAVRSGAGDGAVTSRDVLLEQALTTSSPWAERLVQVLEPLTAGPDLLTTLEAWFSCDFDRRATAELLQVHPNTVDYRLKRIATTTGIEPGTARGIQLLGAALIARTVR